MKMKEEIMIKNNASYSKTSMDIKIFSYTISNPFIIRFVDSIKFEIN